jgi:hypothetical protein
VAVRSKHDGEVPIQPVDLLKSFHQIESVEPAETIWRAAQLDDAAGWG